MGVQVSGVCGLCEVLQAGVHVSEGRCACREWRSRDADTQHENAALHRPTSSDTTSADMIPKPHCIRSSTSFAEKSRLVIRCC